MNTCVCCGAIIPEGRQVCPNCETWSDAPDAILADGTPLYLRSTEKPKYGSLQLELYDLLTGYKRAIGKED